MASPSVLGLILAGGLGRRMGGVDKGWVPFQGQPMVARVVERLAPQVGAVVISANRSAEAYAALGFPLVADRVAGFIGPLAGLDAVFHWAGPRWDWVATCPCDAPNLPLDLVARLLTAVRAAQADVAMARSDGQPQPVFLLAHRRLAPSLADDLAAGERAVIRWVEGENHVVVDFDDCPGAFANINTPEDMAGLPPGDPPRS